MSWIRQHPKGVFISIKAVPRASRCKVEGVHGDALKIRLTAPPVEGKANKALLDFLSEKLGVPRSAVTLAGGMSSRNKLVFVAGASVAPACAALGLPEAPDAAASDQDR